MILESSIDVCQSSYFKCPGFYCLPWRFVCNGQWECPGGTDEIHCNKTTCPGMFKCKASSICISYVSLCDVISDCPLNDDEYFCYKGLTLQSCPSNCSCLQFSLFCQEFTLAIQYNIKFYFAIFLLDIDLSKSSSIWKLLNEPIVLILKNTQLVSICEQSKVYVFKCTQKLDISSNDIKLLTTNCFGFVTNIHFLNVSFNGVRLIAPHTFFDSIQIKQLDLSWNAIYRLGDRIFAGLFQLSFLNLTGNPIISVSTSTFSNASITNIVTLNFKVCCIVTLSNTMCTSKPMWPNSCSRLLGDNIVKKLIWSISTIGLVMNVLSCLIISQKSLSRGNAYRRPVVCLSISDTLCCLQLLTIVVADLTFRNDYLEYEHYWRANFVCIFSSFLSFITNFLSVFTINLLALTRYCIVKNPLDSNFLEASFLTRLCVIASSIITVLSILAVLSYLHTTGQHQLPTGLCLLPGHGHKSNVAQIVTIVTFLSQSSSCFSIPVIYCLLLKEKAKTTARVGRTDSGGLTKFILVAFTNLICWVPSSVLLFMTLVWKQYPYILLIWTTMVIIPLNAIINPSVFVLSGLSLKDMGHLLCRVCTVKSSSPPESRKPGKLARKYEIPEEPRSQSTQKTSSPQEPEKI